jgi:hypothetical protein
MGSYQRYGQGGGEQPEKQGHKFEPPEPPSVSHPIIFVKRCCRNDFLAQPPLWRMKPECPGAEPGQRRNDERCEGDDEESLHDSR